MSKTARKITTLSTRGGAFLCSLIAFFTLLINFVIKVKVEVKLSAGGSTLATDTDAVTGNFFYFMRFLGRKGGDLSCGGVLVAFMIVTIAIAAALVVFEVISLITKKSFSNKIFKIVFLAVSAFALLTFILAIVVQAESGDWLYCSSGYQYYSGYKFWVRTTALGRYNFVAAIILLAVTFAAQAFAGVLGLLAKEEPVAVAEAAVSVEPENVAEAAPVEAAPVEETPVEETPVEEAPEAVTE